MKKSLMALAGAVCLFASQANANTIVDIAAGDEIMPGDSSPDNYRGRCSY